MNLRFPDKREIPWSAKQVQNNKKRTLDYTVCLFVSLRSFPEDTPHENGSNQEIFVAR